MLAQLQRPSARWRFALGCARVALSPPRQGGLISKLREIAANPGAAALIGLLLALPLSLTLLVAGLEIEPLQGFLRHWLTEAGSPRNSTFGLLILLGSLSLLPVALVINLVPVVRNVRAGHGLRAHPVNLSLAVALLVFIAALAGGFIADQYPCWMGVPNCD